MQPQQGFVGLFQAPKQPPQQHEPSYVPYNPIPKKAKKQKTNDLGEFVPVGETEQHIETEGQVQTEGQENVQQPTNGLQPSDEQPMPAQSVVVPDIVAPPAPVLEYPERYHKSTWPKNLHHPKVIVAHYFKSYLYSTLDPHRFIVQLQLEGQVFEGRGSVSIKEAQHNAALAALRHFKLSDFVEHHGRQPAKPNVEEVALASFPPEQFKKGNWPLKYLHPKAMLFEYYQNDLTYTELSGQDLTKILPDNPPRPIVTADAPFLFKVTVLSIDKFFVPAQGSKTIKEAEHNAALCALLELGLLYDFVKKKDKTDMKLQAPKAFQPATEKTTGTAFVRQTFVKSSEPEEESTIDNVGMRNALKSMLFTGSSTLPPTERVPREFTEASWPGDLQDPKSILELYYKPEQIAYSKTNLNRCYTMKGATNGVAVPASQSYAPIIDDRTDLCICTISSLRRTFFPLMRSKNRAEGEQTAALTALRDLDIISDFIARKMNQMYSTKNQQYTGNPYSFNMRKKRPVDDWNKGNIMLRQMGWNGGTLGRTQEGLEEPIDITLKNNRHGIGHQAIRPPSHNKKESNELNTFRLSIIEKIQSLVSNPEADHATFSVSTGAQKTILEEIAQKWTLTVTVRDLKPGEQIIVSKGPGWKDLSSVPSPMATSPNAPVPTYHVEKQLYSQPANYKTFIPKGYYSRNRNNQYYGQDFNNNAYQQPSSGTDYSAAWAQYYATYGYPGQQASNSAYPNTGYGYGTYPNNPSSYSSNYIPQEAVANWNSMYNYQPEKKT